MRINGTEEIIKLLLEIKVGGREIRNSDNPVSIEKIAEKVEEIISSKDEFIQSDRGRNIKTEIQFSRNLNESPEAYLHRISNELSQQRGTMNIGINDTFDFNESNVRMMETAIRSGLLKDFMGIDVETSHEPSVDNRPKWLNRFIVIVSMVLMIYFFLIQ